MFGCTPHRYIGIREDTTHAFTVSGLFDVTDVWVDTNQIVHYPGDRTSTFGTLIDTVNASAGWWREFDEQGERALTTSLVFGGAVLFTTFVPTADVCSYGGKGNLRYHRQEKNRNNNYYPFHLANLLSSRAFCHSCVNKR